MKPELILDPAGHKSRVNKILFTNDEKFLISCSDDKSVKIWDIASGECVKTLRGSKGAGIEGVIYTIALSPDDTDLAVEGYFAGDILYNEGYESIRIYNLKTGKIIKSSKRS